MTPALTVSTSAIQARSCVGLKLATISRGELLERVVPAVFARVELAVALDEPAEVAGLQAAQGHGAVGGRVDRCLESAHRLDRYVWVWERVEQCADLLGRALVQLCDDVLARAPSAAPAAGGHRGGRLALHDAALLEAREQAAQLAARRSRALL